MGNMRFLKNRLVQFLIQTTLFFLTLGVIVLFLRHLGSDPSGSPRIRYPEIYQKLQLNTDLRVRIELRKYKREASLELEAKEIIGFMPNPSEMKTINGRVQPSLTGYFKVIEPGMENNKLGIGYDVKRNLFYISDIASYDDFVNRKFLQYLFEKADWPSNVLGE